MNSKRMIRGNASDLYENGYKIALILSASIIEIPLWENRYIVQHDFMTMNDSSALARRIAMTA